MTGIHGLQHVEGFFAATLANDDAVWPHAQSVLDELALPDFAFALSVRRSRFQSPHVRLLQLQLRRILDRNQAFVAVECSSKGH